MEKFRRYFEASSAATEWSVVKAAKATDLEVAKEEGDTVYHSMTLTFPGGEQLHLSSKVTIKDGQVIRVEPVDPAAYSKLVQNSS